MRIETVTADTIAAAYALCPWAARVTQVESGDNQNAYMCFESISDFDTWLAQS